MSEVKDTYSADILSAVVGPITYDESAPMVKTYCSECGHETGEERPHAANCICISCRHLRNRLRTNRSAEGMTITFRKFQALNLPTKIGK